MFILALFILSCKSIWLLLSSLNITPKYLKFSTLSNLRICNFLISWLVRYSSIQMASYVIARVTKSFCTASCT